MKTRILIMFVLSVMVLAACGSKGMDESFALKDHNGSEVNFPQEKPVLFFFITTYT